MNPNLFAFATSELSQDAILCWLLSWADADSGKTRPDLQWVGRAFLTAIYQRANIPVPEAYATVEVRKQDGGIDILGIVNGKTAILIEDKTGTKQHSEQLPRYRTHARKLGFADDCVIPVYIQTGDQSDCREVAKQGYLVLERRDLLNVMESDAGKTARRTSDILDDFSKHLRLIEDDVQSFQSTPPSAWSWNAWKGFYTHLQSAIQDGNWDYVANPAGGFLGFWWHFGGKGDVELYLQLEQGQFCFKIAVGEAADRRGLRDQWHKQVIENCTRHGIVAKRPGRFGSGQYMTVAILDHVFPVVKSNGLVDMEETLKVIQSAQCVVDDCLSGNRQSQSAPNC